MGDSFNNINNSNIVNRPAKRLDEFKVEVFDQMVRHPEWRFGQAAFNVLWEMDQELAKLVTGASFDPFYVDERMPAFMAVLEKRWHRD